MPFKVLLTKDASNLQFMLHQIESKHTIQALWVFEEDGKVSKIDFKAAGHKGSSSKTHKAWIVCLLSIWWGVNWRFEASLVSNTLKSIIY